MNASMIAHQTTWPVLTLVYYFICMPCCEACGEEVGVSVGAGARPDERRVLLTDGAQVQESADGGVKRVLCADAGRSLEVAVVHGHRVGA